MKDELRTDGDPIAWRTWSSAQNQLWQLRQPAPPLNFLFFFWTHAVRAMTAVTVKKFYSLVAMYLTSLRT